jgi:predicted ATPase
LPIVTHALRQSENTLHIIEQPELHLHPAAHGDIAELIAESVTATEYSKFVIETHSENFILRLRRLIAEKKLPAENVVIYWVDYQEEAEASQLQKIEISPNGEVSFWPKGIFSEDYEEIKAIGKAQRDQ